MSRQMPGSFGIDQSPQLNQASPYPTPANPELLDRVVGETQARSIYSINLPPQYRRQMEAATLYPDEMDIRMPFEQIGDMQAVKIVRHDFENAANYRWQNHDWRWTIADTLYTGWKQPKFWEGTKIPRSALSVMVSFEQIEALMPTVMQALFGERDWFEAKPFGSTPPASARAIRDIMVEQLSDCNPREQVRRMVKSACMYGNGIIQVGWKYLIQNSLQSIPEFVPKRKTIWHPIDGRPIEVPSGEFDRIIREFELEEVINTPYLSYIPLRRFYIDPNCPGPLVQEGQYSIVESYMSVDDLDALRRSSGFESMPDRQYLLLMSKEKAHYQSDTGTAEQESARRASYSPMIDQSTDPAKARLKVIHYFTRDRIMWSLNNQFMVFNKPNPIGRVTIYDAFYADLLDRFYAMAISDIVEPEQRAQEGLLNARFDELSLGVFPQTVKQRGNGTPVYQVRVRPGGVAESQDPKNDVIRQYPMNMTANTHIEAQASELRVQKMTGVTDLSMVGVGTSTNPGARTATGAGAQVQAAGRRVQYIVENIEWNVVEPAMGDVFLYNQRFLDPNQMIETAAGVKLDPIVIWGSKVKFGMRASSRMQSRQALLSMMPMTLQAMLNPQLLAQLASVDQTVDIVELMEMFMDASGYKEKSKWIRELTPQEKQKLNKPSKAQEDMALQQDRMGRLREMQVNKSEMEMLKMALDNQFKMQLEQIKAQLDKLMNKNAEE